MNKTKVSIVKGGQSPSAEEVDKMVREAVELVGGLKDIVKAGDRVLVKPNIAYKIKPGETEVTDPRVTRTVCDLVKEAGGNPFIGEASAAGVDTEKAMQTSGYAALRDEGYEVIAFDKTETISIPVDGGIALKKAKVYKLAYDADVIVSVPVIKTHDQEPATLSLKNMKGTMPPREKKNFHLKYGLFQAIADLNKVVRPHFVVVDGIFCRDGLGYPFSKEIELDIVLAGQDPVAVDTITHMIMIQNPIDSAHLQLCYQQGIGTANPDEIEVVGKTVNDVKVKFNTSDELFADKFSQYNIIRSDMTCTGCRGMLHFMLALLEDQEKLDVLKEFTIVNGPVDQLPQVDADKLLLVGDCTAKHKKDGTFISGCPPFGSNVISAMFGEDVDNFWVEEEIKEDKDK